MRPVVERCLLELGREHHLARAHVPGAVVAAAAERVAAGGRVDLVVGTGGARTAAVDAGLGTVAAIVGARAGAGRTARAAAACAVAARRASCAVAGRSPTTAAAGHLPRLSAAARARVGGAATTGAPLRAAGAGAAAGAPAGPAGLAGPTVMSERIASGEENHRHRRRYEQDSVSDICKSCQASIARRGESPKPTEIGNGIRRLC